MNEILLGDIRDIAKTLPDQSVNCIVTSPPYFGLRDYQTAKWEGGKAECDHVPNKEWIARNFSSSGSIGKPIQGNDAQYKAATARWYKKGTCPKCGAKRIDNQIGLEESSEAYVDTLVGIFRELKRVLRDDGTLWLNLGDSYTSSGQRQTGRNDNGRPEKNRGWAEYDITRTEISLANNSLKPKNLIGIPWRVAFALQADGWILRSDIIWHKKNPMPESVKDRPTKAHEYIFLLSKKPRYYYDGEAVREAVTESSIDRAKYSLNNNHSGYFRDAGTGSTFEKTRNGATMGEAGFVNPSGRNRRTVWTVSKPVMKLRDDLTPEQKSYVLDRLFQCGLV